MNILFINRAAEKLTGYSRQEATRKKCYEVFGDDGRRCRNECPVEKVLRDDRHLVHHEGKLKTRSGEVKDMRVSISPLRDGSSLAGAVVFLENLSYLGESRESHVKTAIKLQKEIELRNKIESALKDSSELLNKLLSISPIGIGIVEKDRFTWVNDTMCSMLGVDGNAHFKEAGFETIFSSKGDYEDLAKEIRIGLSGEDPVERDVVLKRLDGSEFHGHLKMQGFSESETDHRLVFTLADISKRKQAEKEKRKKEKLEGILQLAGAVCHEFNQPLQAISGFSSLLICEFSRDDPRFNMVKTIVEQVDRMNRLTDQVMHITTVETMEYLDSPILDIEKSTAFKY
jgi:PAS domain S-box-containing protein